MKRGFTASNHRGVDHIWNPCPLSFIVPGLYTPLLWVLGWEGQA